RQPAELVAVIGDQRGRHYGRMVRYLAFDADGTSLVSAALDGSIRIWDPATMKELSVLREAPDTRTTAITVSADRTKSAAADGKGVIWIWDKTRGKDPISLPDAHGGKTVLALAISPDGKYLGSGGEDNQVRIWDLTSNPPQAPPPMPGHGASV